MKIYLLRHGIAEAASYQANDAKRELTDEGRAGIALVGRALRSLGVAPHPILASPLARAQQTAAIVAAELKLKAAPVQSEALVPWTPFAQARTLLAEYAAEEQIMVVGHEPHLSGLAMELCGGGTGALKLKKGGLCRIDIDDPAATGALVWLLTPKLLAELGR